MSGRQKTSHFGVPNWAKSSRDQKLQQGVTNGEGMLITGYAPQVMRVPGQCMEGKPQSPENNSVSVSQRDYSTSSKVSQYTNQDSRNRISTRGAPASPTRAYDASSERVRSPTHPPARPPKNSRIQDGDGTNMHRRDLERVSPEPTLAHRETGGLESHPPAGSWSRESGISQPFGRTQSPVDENHQNGPIDTQEWQPGDDPVYLEDLRHFHEVAWNRILKRDALLRGLNAQHRERKQIMLALDVSHYLLFDSIARHRNAEVDLSRQLEQAKSEHKASQDRRELEHNKWVWNMEQQHLTAINEMETTNKRKLHTQAAEIEEKYKGHIFTKDQQLAKFKIALEKKDEVIRQEYQKILDEKVEEMTQKEEALSNEKTRLIEDMKKLERRKNQEIFEIEQAHENEKTQVQETHEQALDELQQQIEAAEKDRDDHIANLESLHASDRKKLTDDFGAQAQRYETTIDTLRGKHERQVNQQETDHKKFLAELQTTHEQKLAQLSQIHQNKEAKMLAEHDRNSKTLVEEVHSLNRVLLTRDNESYTPPMLSEADLKQAPDEYVKAKFTELVQMVDDLSRLVWRTDQQVWTDDVLRSLGAKQTQRLLKKGILQDTIWTIVHRHIFCSPFRMFGKEGRNLEDQWNERCGQDPNFDNGIYTWPTPTIETERWRYITLKECRKALIEPIPSQYDPRAKLKMGFKTAKDAFVSELKSTLDEMVEWGGTDTSSVERLAKRVANVWLEFGMYRCRFVVFFRGEGMAGCDGEEKVERAREGGVELNVVPGLRRHGNVKGVELGRSTVVGGFDGECVRLGG